MNDFIKSLTDNDILDWAGETIFNRATGYLDKVDNFAAFGDDAIIADSGNYSVYLELNEDREFFSRCTCPCHFQPCKHAAAAALILIKRLNNGMVFDDVHPDDGRLEELELKMNYDDFHGITHEKSTLLDDASLKIILNNRPKDELVSIIINTMMDYPALRRTLTDVEIIKSGDISAVVQNVKEKIENITPTDVYDERMKIRNMPDFQYIRASFLSLREAGEYGYVIRLGEFLFRQVTELLEYSEGDRDIEFQTFLCMEEVADAVMASDMSDAEKVYWVFIHDIRYRIAPDHNMMLDDINFDKSVWLECIVKLKERVKHFKKREIPFFEEARAEFEDIIDQICLCYRLAGWPDEYLDFLKSEADEFLIYQEFASAHLQKGRAQEGTEWLRSRLSDTETDWKRKLIFAALEYLYRQTDDYEAAAECAYQTLCIKPAFSDYERLMMSAEKCNKSGYYREIVVAKLIVSDVFRVHVAMYHNDADELNRLFGNYPEILKLSIADILAEKHFTTAFGIWRDEVLRLVRQTNRKSYEKAAVILSKIRVADNGEYEKFLTLLRSEFKHLRVLKLVLKEYGL